MLTKEQIEAVMRFTEQPKHGRGGSKAEAYRIGLTPGTFNVLVHNCRKGRVPPSWRRTLEKDSE